MVDLAKRFRSFAETTRRRAPLYSRLSAGIAGAPVLATLFADAPRPARVPVTLFAAVHDLLLADPEAPLARFYPNLRLGGEVASGDPVPEFLAFCDEHSAELRGLIGSRLPQTNEVGRAALLLAGIGQWGGGPVSLLDVGASAGLNLLLDRYAYTDGSGHLLGDSAVVLECSTRDVRPGAVGPHGLADALPVVQDRCGLDTNPVDLADPEAVRWLEACVWPDQADRFARLDAALRLAAEAPPPVRRGDAVADLGQALAGLEGERVVVTTSWVLAYLSPERQRDFVAEFDRLAGGRELAWVWVEAPHQVGVLPVPPELRGDTVTVLGLSTWRGGVRTDRVLGRCHPHGYWLHWR